MADTSKRAARAGDASATGVSRQLPDEGEDPGIVVSDDAASGSEAFIRAIAAHRHPQRETDPPAI